jgi:hypothetical protein
VLVGPLSTTNDEGQAEAKQHARKDASGDRSPGDIGKPFSNGREANDQQGSIPKARIQERGPTNAHVLRSVIR